MANETCRQCAYFQKEGGLKIGACIAPAPFWLSAQPAILPADQTAGDCPCFQPRVSSVAGITRGGVNRLLKHYRMAGRTAEAVKDFLLKGIGPAEAARARGVSRQAVHAMLHKIGERRNCPACGQSYTAVPKEG